jgi:hypothetical protein
VSGRMTQARAEAPPPDAEHPVRSRAEAATTAPIEINEVFFISLPS